MAMRIYTRTGDDGTSAISQGRRFPKDSALFNALGTGQELNAILGMVITELYEDLNGTIAGGLRRVQKELFSIGAMLALDKSVRASPDPRWMELEIDAATDAMPRLTNFILPGGCRAGAMLHWAATVARRFERSLQPCVEMPYSIDRGVLAYVNRLSDYLFTVARYVNNIANQSEPLWINQEA